MKASEAAAPLGDRLRGAVDTHEGAHKIDAEIRHKGWYINPMETAVFDTPIDDLAACRQHHLMACLRSLAAGRDVEGCGSFCSA